MQKDNRGIGPPGAPKEFQIEFEIWLKSQTIKQLSLILPKCQTDSSVIVIYFDEKYASG